ncbi:hypothetical protein POM88_043029 [Heracleum sosnowskyi]|uniref:Uncharacterized protein n=1 Tax=Heracleum sosnowskyi TaxID=360622 RepID=A0AAD8HJI1_9APIA|nr:hypothetical protein POM88_043029 [Heracleum sosnowskyi]
MIKNLRICEDWYVHEPIYNLPELISMVAQTKVSVDRIRNLICEQENMRLARHPYKDSDIAIELEQGEYAWDENDQCLLTSVECDFLHFVSSPLNNALNNSVCVFVCGYHHENRHMKALDDSSLVDKHKNGYAVKLQKLPAGSPPGLDTSHLDLLNKLREFGHKGQSVVVFDDQDRIMKTLLYTVSLYDVRQSFA